VLVDAHPASPHHKLRREQIVTIEWPAPVVAAKRAKAPLPFPIIFEDDALLVINKPSGMVVHPSVGHTDGKSLVELVEPFLAGQPWPDETRPGLVHRLDRDTSGVIVMAKTPEVHADLSKQFARRQTKKTYQALAKGTMKAKEGTLECHIARHPGMRQRFAVSAAGRWASTKFKVLEKFGELASLVELYPLTGRTHQLRVQLSEYGHPILGDHVYGVAEKEFNFVKRQMLHAMKIELKHPATGKTMQFEAKLPDDFQDNVKVIRSLQ
jgi:23S rRNA pseudouridine1911/1915/1917 synthase